MYINGPILLLLLSLMKGTLRRPKVIHLSRFFFKLPKLFLAIKRCEKLWKVTNSFTFFTIFLYKLHNPTRKKWKITKKKNKGPYCCLWFISSVLKTHFENNLFLLFFSIVFWIIYLIIIILDFSLCVKAR